MGVVFGCFLSLVVTYNSNSFFSVNRIKRHKFRVPTTHIGKTKIILVFCLFNNFDRIFGGSKRPKNQEKSVSICFNMVWSPYSQQSKFLSQKINVSQPPSVQGVLAPGKECNGPGKRRHNWHTHKIFYNSSGLSEIFVDLFLANVLS